MWCVQIGYGRKEMAEAISAQILKVPYYSPWNMSAAPSALLAKKLAGFAPGDLKHVFFTTCGSTAVDSAIRFVHFTTMFWAVPARRR
jgi:adenosylmethionine-8-amino-7-oxononanoate aminotransferase